MEWSEDTPQYDEDSDHAPESLHLEKRYSASTAAAINMFDERLIPYDLIMRLLDKICFEGEAHFPFSGAILIFMPVSFFPLRTAYHKYTNFKGMGEIRRMNDALSEHPRFGQSQDFVIYPLHSTISSENQSAVFGKKNSPYL